MTHIIVMGIIHKLNLEADWHACDLTKMFFGCSKISSRICILLTMMQTQMQTNKLQCFITMVQRNFQHAQRSHMEINIDESLCPFKGRVNQIVSISSYLLLASQQVDTFVYTRISPNDILGEGDTPDPYCTRTIKTVMGLLNKLDLLACGRHWYTSPKLMKELTCRTMWVCGTVGGNRK